MGFDLYIMVQFMIDTHTGLPIVCNKSRDNNALCDQKYQVPEQYRRFVQQRGHWFSRYVSQFEGTSVSADVFLAQYPEWEPEDDIWTKEDHDDFQTALEWFSRKGNFVVVWS